MGEVNFGAPRELIELLRTTYKMGSFIETGTHLGGTTVWASERFERVVTIEGSADFHRAARERHGDRSNIEFLLGDSRTLLPKALTREVGGPALLWLDAHWMPGSFGAEAECPVVQEIEAINRSSPEHFLLIDDARLFLAPPPLPHRAADWPDIEAVMTALHADATKPRYTVIHDDVIVSVPDFARVVVREFFQAQITAQFHVEQQTTVTTAWRSKVLRRCKRIVTQTLSRLWAN